MKSIKRGLAVLLAVLLMMPTLPARVEAASVSDGDLTTTVSAENNESSAADKVVVNTGNFAFSVTDPSVSDNLVGDTFFEEDGSYTIDIPETNPFFPYEVQFTCDGEVTTEWFMTPDDSVEVGGHTFYVSADFDGTVMTQLTLDVAGKKVVVYPQKKEFTNGVGMMMLSLQPLEEKYLDVDLTGFTPAELTMVSVDTLLAGADSVEATDKIIWKSTSYSDSNDEYTINAKGDKVDLSYDTYYGGSKRWEMIVGEVDQLATDNIRYIVDVDLKRTREWLIPTAYIQDATGVRTPIEILDYEYEDYSTNRRVYNRLSNVNLGNSRQVYMGLTINPDVFATPQFASYKVYSGNYETAQEAMAATDITAQLFATDMTQVNAGYPVNRSTNTWVTMVTFDASGNVTGCLPFRLYWTHYSNGISRYSMCKRVADETYYDGYRTVYVADTTDSTYRDGCYYYTITLYKDYSASDIFYQEFDYSANGESAKELVTAAYVGNYATIAEAQAAGATDIKVDLFAMNGCTTEGYGADYSQGVYFTIFVGADGAANQEVYRYHYQTVNGSTPSFVVNEDLDSDTVVTFTGLVDAEGNVVKAYQVASKHDSYAEFNYLTILVEEDVDLTNVAPKFRKSDKINLYATGSSAPEESGKSFHDFSNGPVQYTAAAEDGLSSKNYWVQVITAKEGAGQLYVNSLAAVDAGTRVEDGVTHTVREVMIDGYHKDVHDILIANMGTEAIEKLSVELVSDTVELDEYWTLTGNHDLSGFTTVNEYTNYGELSNLAKVRIKAKSGVEDATAISGILTFKSAGKTVMVMHLTGMVGDPVITTKEIPAAVKYVPYGTMIQNSNKYSWNRTTYELYSGSLPAGMTIKSNGEIYGVPTETGEFNFEVRMRNSAGQFSDDYATFTLKVIENTDANVDAATDTGYDLTQRVQGLDIDAGFDENGSQTLVSQGVYAEFVDIYLDGRKLVAGTDYTSESGSTRITILNQTLADVEDNESGIHTLGVEFRTQGTDVLKRAAQNYSVKGEYVRDDVDDEESDDNSGSYAPGSGDDDDDDDDEKSTSSSKGSSSKPAGTVAGTTAQPQYTQLNIVEGAVSHTVASGESLWSIAQKYYGDGSKWNKIYEDNKNSISDPNSIYVGQVLIINEEATGSAATGTSPLAGTNAYVVQSGDTLWKIADKLYGKGWKWRTIYEANKNIIADPESIYVGQVLVVP